MYVRDVRFPNSAGIDPANWLSDRSRYVSARKLPSAAGNVPLSAFLRITSQVKARKLLIEAGTVPVSVFVPPLLAWSKLKYTRSVKFPIALGIVPPSALLYSPLAQTWRQTTQHAGHAAARG